MNCSSATLAGEGCHTDSTDITDFLHCYACRGADAFFFLLLAALTRSCISRRLFPFGDFFSGCGAGLDLVDFYKVSLASRDELFFCYARGGACHTDSTDITDFSALLRLQRGWRILYSPARGAREIYKSCKFLFLRDFVRVRGWFGSGRSL